MCFCEIPPGYCKILMHLTKDKNVFSLLKGLNVAIPLFH